MSQSNRIWAIQENGVWSRWAPEFSRWDIFSELRKFIFADPTTGEACYYVDPNGSVHWRNVDQNENMDFPGIEANMVSVGGSNRLWAVQKNGVWARWAPEFSRWDIFSETRKFIFADPKTQQACYYVDPDGSVHWRNVDKNENKSFPGIKADSIAVGGDERLWAIQENGVWARWAPEFSRWDVFSETRKFIFADPTTQQACYYVDPDGSVHWRNVDKNENQKYPGIKANIISVGGV